MPSFGNNVGAGAPMCPMHLDRYNRCAWCIKMDLRHLRAFVSIVEDLAVHGFSTNGVAGKAKAAVA